MTTTLEDETLSHRQAVRPRDSGPIGPFTLGPAAVFFLILVMAGANAYRDRERAILQEHELLEDGLATKQRIETLKNRLYDLDNSPQLLERLAREELGLVSSDDIVIVLPEDPNQANGSQEDPDPDSVVEDR